MSRNWRKGFEIVWHGDNPSEDIEAQVREDMLECLWGLDRPSHLGFHTVWLDDDYSGRTVIVWGENRDRRFHAEYSEKTEYVTLGGEPVQ